MAKDPLNYSWQYKMRERVRVLEEDQLRLSQQVTALQRENNLLRKLVEGPPTALIACEKIAEAAAQLTTSANEICKRSLERR